MISFNHVPFLSSFSQIEEVIFRTKNEVGLGCSDRNRMSCFKLDEKYYANTNAND